VALETGIQNAPLAITIIVLNFAPEDRQSILAVVALYALFIVVTSTLLTLVFRRAATGAD
jgi:BASS family bile acid:Na+ symporter